MSLSTFKMLPAGNPKCRQVFAQPFKRATRTSWLVSAKLWLKWFETLRDFPPMQAPASYNLSQVMEQIEADAGHPAD
jgi:hypothetical protein